MENIDFNNILNVIKPTQEENEKVKSLSDRLINIINRIAKENSIDAEATLVGSVAKGTWLSGKADVDIFMKFPLSTSEADLKRYGLELGSKCIDEMHGKHELRYASHPYITGFIEGFEIDFVPCYIIKSAEELKSAVDRTILHTEYVLAKLREKQKDEVLLLKKFMGSIHTYSAEFKVGGFSGYLCELLIIHYGSFLNVLNAASNEWRPNYKIDIEEYGTGELFSEPLVVIDPTDKNRNVAAALKLQKMSEFIVASRNFLTNPKEGYFFDKYVEINKDEIKTEFESRETKTCLIRFKPPEIPADALYPQIKKTENSLKGVLEREDFKVFNADSWTDESQNVIILLEMEIWKLPRVKKHLGPFVWSKGHQIKFMEKYNNNAYVEENRWVAEVDRKYKEVKPFLDNILVENKIGFLKFGKHIKAEILKEYEIVDILEFMGSDKCSEDMLLFFYEYLNKNVYLWR
ncbi:MULTISPECIES: CCA tRNA nucleotidyltransferase [Methanobacterium]|uniref:CCA-adding enzyme n=1 Tax=Methanobacterium veterum TaxID=408577 RepID=A0A9E5DK39_9EURY|nr:MULTISPECIES: CCA tRNA nucleotidyltransferase [Methanobacterium]MCZ3364339.1 CCA tRNA nucleotidyltransferase [Methanobacterium veterum]MCZ3372089.1 CCA tRNA nucleotidyltransferase [Methanobacterium veterum]